MKKITDIFKNAKMIPLLITAFAVGALLLVFAGKKDESTESINVNEFTFDFNTYETELEARVSAKLNKLEGVSGCETIIILDESYVFEYVRDDDGSIFVYDYDDTELTLIERERAPKVRGVAVICNGGESPDVKARVTDMLCALFDISTNDVWVGGKE